jgi:predicted permease
LAPTNLPRLEEVTLDASVLLFTLVVSVGSGLFFGLFPMLRHRRGNLVNALKEGGRSGTGGLRRHRAQNLLAISQMALALVLLVGSGLMLRSFQTMRSMDPGFEDPEELYTLTLYIPGREIPDVAEMAATHEAIVHRLEEIPGVSSVGLATGMPMAGGNNVNPFYVQGQPLLPGAPVVIRRHKWIGEGYLETMRIPLLMGRSFTWDDVHNRAPVAMLSETLAREVFGSPEAAMGEYIAARPDPGVWKEVIGIVKDVREDGMGADPPPLVYWPQVTLGFWEGNPEGQVQSWRTGRYVVRSNRVGTPGFPAELESAVWEVNPNLPLLNTGSMSEFVSRSMAGTSFTMVLLGVAGAVALILGLVGVYGVISYAVAQRSRELGMRMALGAEANRVLGMVVRQGMALAGVGVVVGLALAFGTTRLMSAVLFGVSPVDPLTFASVSGGLLLIAILASYLPARRASRVDPVVALRTE